MVKNDQRIKKYVEKIIDTLPTKPDDQLRELLIVLQRMELTDEYKQKYRTTVKFNSNMKRLLILALSIATFSQIQSQDFKTKKKTDKYYKEVYQVNKVDKTKTGFYYKISIDSGDTLVTGRYSKNVKIDTWNYYGQNNCVYMSYNFNTKSMRQIQGAENRIDSFYVLKNGEFVFEKIDSPPLYLGYKNEAKQQIARNISVTSDIFDNQLQGQAIASFTVDSLGNLINQKIEQSLTSNFDKEIMDSFNKLDGNWIPAYANGRPISSKIYIIFDVRSSINISKSTDLPHLWYLPLFYYTTTITRQL